MHPHTGSVVSEEKAPRAPLHSPSPPPFLPDVLLLHLVTDCIVRSQEIPKSTLVLQINRTKRRQRAREGEGDFKKLAHTVMGAGKSEIHRARLETHVRVAVTALSLKVGNADRISMLQSRNRIPSPFRNLTLGS